jgi:hypothetical protein
MDGVLVIYSASDDGDGVTVWGPTRRNAKAEFVAVTGWTVVLMKSGVVQFIQEVATRVIVCIPAPSELVGGVEPRAKWGVELVLAVEPDG